MIKASNEFLNNFHGHDNYNTRNTTSSSKKRDSAPGYMKLDKYDDY